MPHDEFAQIRETFDFEQAGVSEPDAIEEVIAESERLESVDRSQKTQVPAAIASAVDITVPDRTGKMQLLQVRQAAQSLEIRWIDIHAEPVQNFELDIASRQVGNVGVAPRLAGKTDAAAHRQGPFRHVPVD